jgi:hypothetical protein
MRQTRVEKEMRSDEDMKTKYRKCNQIRKRGKNKEKKKEKHLRTQHVMMTWYVSD